ncbi:MAG: IPT/TIG domain-containing protein, partial [Micrococcales bacterium]
SLALNSGYQITFVSANLTITGTAPAVTTQPLAQVVLPGAPVTFSAAASGNPVPAVKWQVLPVGGAWTDIAGATSTSYTFTPAASDDAKQFRAVFTNAVGTATSSAVSLSVVSISSFTPTSGAAATSVVITGTGFTGATAVKFNGTAATSFTVNSNTQITAKVASGTTTGAITVTKGGVTATSAASFTVTAAPAITTQPTSQTVANGSSVTFTAAASGSPTPGVQWQSGSGTTFTNIVGATSTSYTFTPAATDDGKQFRAVFTNSSGSATSTAATLTVVSIASFTPASGPVGTSVVITGTGFTGATAVKFGATAASAFTVNSNTQITARVAAGTVSGAVSVTKGGVTATSAASFTVTIATTPPTISAITPTSGGVGTTVTITGTNFSGATSVKFAGTTAGTLVGATFKVLSATSIIASVPTGSGTGGIVVTTPGGSATSASFKGATTLVLPTVTVYSVTSARTGTAFALTLTGTNFAGTSAVALNGVSLAFNVVSATSLTVTIPSSGVATGVIKVTTNGGVSANTNVLSLLSAPIQLAAGASHSCAALADGTAKCWGLNTNGQLGDNTTVQKTSPVLVSGLTGVSSVAAGTAFSCAVLNAGVSGTVKCWGLNTNGQLGDATTTQRLTPVSVANIVGAVQVVAGASHACALLSDGTVRCWGLNTNGQLGDGTTVQKTSPALTSIAGLSGVTAISAGGSTTCALLSTGAVKCWGLNTNGQLGDNTTTQKLVPTAVSGIDGTAAKATAIAVGASHSCALISDGTVRCWGLNSSGQLGDNTLVQKLVPTTVKATASTNLTGVTAISAGAAHTCAIIGSGSTATAKCWGSNANGRLGNGSTTNSSLPVTVTVTLTTGITAIVAGGSHT